MYEMGAARLKRKPEPDHVVKPAWKTKIERIGIYDRD